MSILVILVHGVRSDAAIYRIFTAHREQIVRDRSELCRLFPPCMSGAFTMRVPGELDALKSVIVQSSRDKPVE